MDGPSKRILNSQEVKRATFKRSRFCTRLSFIFFFFTTPLVSVFWIETLFNMHIIFIGSCKWYCFFYFILETLFFLLRCIRMALSSRLIYFESQYEIWIAFASWSSKFKFEGATFEFNFRNTSIIIMIKVIGQFGFDWGRTNIAESKFQA